MRSVTKVLLCVIGVLFLLIVIAMGIFVVSRHVDYDDLTEVRIKRAGTMISVSEEYKLSCEKGTWTASYITTEWRNETVEKTVVTEAFAEQICALLSQNKTHWWDGFDFENPMVFDGEKFVFYMVFSDGKEVEAKGYMVYPMNFDAVWHGFVTMFEEVLGE